MPTFDKVVQEKPPIVLEFGAVFTKIGFAGDATPRKIIRSEVNSCTGRISVFDVDSAKIYDTLKNFLQTIFLKYLLINCKERRIVIIEDMYGRAIIRETLARLLFTHFDVPSLIFLPLQTVALSTLGITTGLVIDIGYNETTVLPVCHGMPIIRAHKDLGIAGKAVLKELKQQLIASGESPDILTHSILEDILVRICFVTSMERSRQYRSRSSNQKKASYADYIICDQRIIKISGSVRETVYEILFEDTNERDSLPHLILRAILDCDIDVRHLLIENLFVIGGIASQTTLLPRLKDELNYILSKYYKDQFFGPLQFKFHVGLGCPNYSAWLGGSLYASTDLVNQQSMIKESYIKLGHVPDWISLCNKK